MRIVTSLEDQTNTPPNRRGGPPARDPAGMPGICRMGRLRIQLGASNERMILTLLLCNKVAKAEAERMESNAGSPTLARTKQADPDRKRLTTTNRNTV